jgi:hypothetical protein
LHRCSYVLLHTHPRKIRVRASCGLEQSVLPQPGSRSVANASKRSALG